MLRRAFPRDREGKAEGEESWWRKYHVLIYGLQAKDVDRTTNVQFGQSVECG